MLDNSFRKMRNSPGLRPNGVVREEAFGYWVVPPKPPREPLGPKLVLPTIGMAPLGPLFVAFFGDRCSSLCLNCFFIDFGSQIWPQIYEKLIKHRHFRVFDAALASSRPSPAPQDDFFIDFYTCEPSFRRDLTVFLTVFTKSRQSLRDHFRGDFWPLGGSKNKSKIDKQTSKRGSETKSKKRLIF